MKAPTLQSIRRSRFLALLAALVVLFLVSPFLDNSPVHRAYLVVLYALVMLAAIGIVIDRRSHRLISLVIGASWIALSLWGLLSSSENVVIFADMSFIVFNVFVLSIVLASVVSAANVDFDTLLGAASVYLLIGMIWTMSYLVIYQLDPGAFSLIRDETRPYFHQFLYFSLATLTTVGYGDITPLSPFAQIWSTLEAVVGTLYMALLVARLVGLYQSQRPRRK